VTKTVTPKSRAPQPTTPTDIWRTRLAQPGWVILPLRFFLAVTFTYAGLLKLIDPTYFDAKAPQSVQQQMALQAKTSPIGSLVGFTAHHAVFFGLLIALGEIAVGLGALLGVFTRLSAFGGLLLALSFYLTVSWNTHPYFFGSDIVFAFGWLTLLLAGDGGLLSVESAVRRRVRAEMGLAPEQVRPESAATTGEVQRRTVLRTGSIAVLAGLGTLLFGAVAGHLSRRHYQRASAAGPTPTPTHTQPGSGSPSATPTPSATQAAPGTAVMPASTVPVGGAAPFALPQNGEPAYVVQPTAGNFEAFTAVCTHMGCTVGFTGGEFACPCHGATYSATTGQVTGGPAPAPLTKVKVTVVNGEVRVV
jgi:thiosulfate dehydrogenase [quinone] large subunit